MKLKREVLVMVKDRLAEGDEELRKKALVVQKM